MATTRPTEIWPLISRPGKISLQATNRTATTTHLPAAFGSTGGRGTEECNQ
jgi:hypothetical protein